MHTATFAKPSYSTRLASDRLGVIASVLCAIHCAATPILLLALPAFGQIWAHPASHWGMALFVIPIAAVMTFRGFRRHQRRWILACMSLGILFIIIGAMLPYMEFGKNPTNGLSFTLPGQSTELASTCTDSCCPSTASASGMNILHVPPAAIVTTLGGIALIITHIGNLCVCRNCCSDGCNSTA